MSKANLARLVVMISGNGSNLQAILDACAAGRLRAQVVAVVSNQPNAYGLERARKAGVVAQVLAKQKDQAREAYDAALADQVSAYNPDWVILAGWMRILSRHFLERFPNKVINLHPALPGTFPGTHAIERAYQAFQRGEIAETGVMVHLVPDEGVDNGPVLGVEHVPIFTDEPLDALEARIHAVEHRLLVDTLREMIQSNE